MVQKNNSHYAPQAYTNQCLQKSYNSNTYTPMTELYVFNNRLVIKLFIYKSWLRK